MKKKDDRLEGVRKKLMLMRQEIIREAKTEIGQILKEGDNYNGGHDDADLADMAWRDVMQAARLGRHRTQLKAIEKALLRAEDGTYGICEDCGEEIPVGRLNAMPFALRCIECQARYETTASEFEDSGVLSSGQPNEEGED
ncbi:MAG TPA: TraR/DksA family transcriptional regulator [Thermodesulfovibrionales bacterium]|nr:TraR/DksA family transcriptional regulator [Thermodesulfovibrionales bacterium]